MREVNPKQKMPMITVSFKKNNDAPPVSLWNSESEPQNPSLFLEDIVPVLKITLHSCHSYTLKTYIKEEKINKIKMYRKPEATV